MLCLVVMGDCTHVGLHTASFQDLVTVVQENSANHTAVVSFGLCNSFQRVASPQKKAELILLHLILESPINKHTSVSILCFYNINPLPNPSITNYNKQASVKVLYFYNNYPLPNPSITNYNKQASVKVLCFDNNYPLPNPSITNYNKQASVKVLCFYNSNPLPNPSITNYNKQAGVKVLCFDNNYP